MRDILTRIAFRRRHTYLVFGAVVGAQMY